MLTLYINDYRHITANGRDVTTLYKRGASFMLDFIHHLFDQGDLEVTLYCRDEVALERGADVGVANIYRYRRTDDGDLVLLDI